MNANSTEFGFFLLAMTDWLHFNVPLLYLGVCENANRTEFGFLFLLETSTGSQAVHHSQVS